MGGWLAYPGKKIEWAFHRKRPWSSMAVLGSNPDLKTFAAALLPSLSSRIINGSSTLLQKIKKSEENRITPQLLPTKENKDDKEMFMESNRWMDFIYK